MRLWSAFSDNINNDDDDDDDAVRKATRREEETGEQEIREWAKRHAGGVANRAARHRRRSKSRIGRSDSNAISSTNHQLITVVIISVFPYNCIFDRLREISSYLGFRRLAIRRLQKFTSNYAVIQSEYRAGYRVPVHRLLAHARIYTVASVKTVFVDSDERTTNYYFRRVSD